MRVKMNLKGINWVKRTLADGSIKEYAYLGRGVGAMRLEGGRDSPEEIERLIGSYQRAKAEHRPTNANTLKGIITAYMQSPDTKLSPRTPQQISPITGHSIHSIERIISRYCANTDKLAAGAIFLLEKAGG
jgi:hypothetical protein